MITVNADAVIEALQSENDSLRAQLEYAADATKRLEKLCIREVALAYEGGRQEEARVVRWILERFDTVLGDKAGIGLEVARVTIASFRAVLEAHQVTATNKASAPALRPKNPGSSLTPL